MFNLDELTAYKKVSGIYAITICGSIQYIGQSKNLYQRWETHASLINNPRGKTATYRKYWYMHKLPPSSIKFIVITTCSTADLNELEAYYIKLYNPRWNVEHPHAKRQPIDKLFHY